MAETKSKKDNYDVVGGIFDFIFEESKKPPERRRKVSPPKYKSTYNPNQPVIDDLVTVLEAPGVFLTSTAPKDVQDALELELLNIPMDEYGGFKITTSNIAQLFEDPNAFVDKAYNTAKARRKAQRALYLGAALTDFVTTMWARQNGEEEFFKISLANLMANKKDEDYVALRALGQYAKSRDALVESREGSEYKMTKGQPPPETGMRETPLSVDVRIPQVLHPTQLDFMAERGLELIGERTFGKQGWKNLDPRYRAEFTDVLAGRRNPLDIVAERTVGVRWKSMDEKERQVERRKLSSLADRDNKDGFARAEVQRYLAYTHGVQAAKNFGKAARGSTLQDGTFSISNKHFRETDSIDIFNPTFYRHLERNNLVEKIKTTQGEEKAKYQRILLLLESNKKGIQERLVTLRTDLASATDPNRRREIRSEIKQTERLSRVLDANNFLGRVGQLEGYLGSIKGVWIGEGVNPIKSIWNQTFFDPKRNNILNPVRGVDDVIGEAGKRGELGREVSFVIAKQFEGKAILNSYNKFGEALYYANPRTWVRSLVTGEGFAWVANKRVESAKSILKGLDGADDIISSMDTLMKKANIADLEKNIQDIMNKINLKNGRRALTPEQLAKIESLLRKSTTFRKLADVFSTPIRFQKKIAKLILDRTKKIRATIVRKMLQNKFLRDIIVKHGGTKLLSKFVAQGSVKALIQSVVSSIAGAIGLTGGPLAIVTFIVTWIVMEIVWQVGKVLIKVQVAIIKFQYQVIKLAILGILGLFFVFLAGAGSSISKYNKSHYPSSNVVPGEVEICDAYGGGVFGGCCYKDIGCIDGWTCTSTPCGTTAGSGVYSCGGSSRSESDCNADSRCFWDSSGKQCVTGKCVKDSTGDPDDPYDPYDVPIDVSCGPGETYEDAFEKAKMYMRETYGDLSSENLSKINISGIKLVWRKLSDNCAWYCQAMTAGEVTCDPCLIDRGSSCDYFIRLSMHELNHWMSSCWPDGDNNPTKMREWGAEYISGNAGGYTFKRTDGSCTKATQVGPSTNECKALGERGMIYAAFCKSGTTYEPCLSDVNNQLKDYRCP